MGYGVLATDFAWGTRFGTLRPPLLSQIVPSRLLRIYQSHAGPERTRARHLIGTASCRLNLTMPCPVPRNGGFTI